MCALYLFYQYSVCSAAKVLTVGLRLPDGVTQPQAGGHHVEHGHVLQVRPPPQQHHQPRLEQRPRHHDGVALDVLGHVAYGHRGHRVDGAKAHQPSPILWMPREQFTYDCNTGTGIVWLVCGDLRSSWSLKTLCICWLGLKSYQNYSVVRSWQDSHK